MQQRDWLAILIPVLIVVTVSIIIHDYDHDASLNDQIDDLVNEIVQLEYRNDFLEYSANDAKDRYNGLLNYLVESGKVNDSVMVKFLTEPEIARVNYFENSSHSFLFPLNIDDFFFPSGWMGDGKYGKQYVNLSFSNGVTKIEYQPGTGKWAGIYWQYPPGNWGDDLGRDLRGASKITFMAMGETGLETVEFKTGGLYGNKKEFSDTHSKTIGKVHLSKNWVKYEIDISDQDLSNVVGAFAWIAEADDNPNKITFYLKDIYFE